MSEREVTHGGAAGVAAAGSAAASAAPAAADHASSTAAGAPPAGAGHIVPRGAIHRRSVLLGIGMAIVLLLIACYFLVPDIYEVETDDAYIEAHLVSVIPKVPAYVQTLYVDDNSRVRAGELLIELDPRDYAVEVDLAQATVEAADSKLAEARTQVVLAQIGLRLSKAEVDVAVAAAALADVNLRRLQSVSDIRGVSTDRIDTAKATVESTHASLSAAQARMQQAAAQIDLAGAQAETAQATLAQSQAQLATAHLNLSYTKIYATDSGSIASKSVEAGNYVQPGQLLLSVVPETPFVVANYKETQLTRVRPGQKVDIRVDAFPQLHLHGHVDSIQRGTGSRFALLPPENATGNFVKIVQRVPVKIVLDGSSEWLQLLAPGMSVETEVFVRSRPAWLGFLH
jgi:membrane fusion protein, multidrug efflux system